MDALTNEGLAARAAAADAKARSEAMNQAIMLINASSGTINPQTWREVRDEIYAFLTNGSVAGTSADPNAYYANGSNPSNES
jgi:hypothetical protein